MNREHVPFEPMLFDGHWIPPAFGREAGILGTPSHLLLDQFERLILLAMEPKQAGDRGKSELTDYVVDSGMPLPLSCNPSGRAAAGN